MNRKLNGDFIDSYCEKYASIVSSGFFVGSKKVISGKEILEVTSSKQVNFFVIKLLFRYWQEETKKLESPFFNYKHEEVRVAMVQFMNILSQHIEINRAKFERLLNHAVKDAIYLCSMPQAYIEIDLDSRGVDYITDKVIEGTVKYLKTYKKEIYEFLNDMKGLTIDEVIDELPDEFEDFDTTEAVTQLVDLLSPTLGITLEKIYSEDPEIEDFDEDDLFVQGEEDLVDTSRKRRPSRIREYHKEDKNVVISNDDEEMEDEEIVEDTFDEVEPLQPKPEKLARELHVPSEKEKLDAIVPPKATPIESLQEEEDIEEELESDTINKQFEKKEETIAEHLESKKKEDAILDMISLNQRYMFIKELFLDDKRQFHQALTQLEGFDSFDSSVEFLVQNYAKDNEWNMQSDEVKEFLKILFRKHR